MRSTSTMLLLSVLLCANCESEGAPEGSACSDDTDCASRSCAPSRDCDEGLVCVTNECRDDDDCPIGLVCRQEKDCDTTCGPAKGQGDSCFVHAFDACGCAKDVPCEAGLSCNVRSDDDLSVDEGFCE